MSQYTGFYTSNTELPPFVPVPLSVLTESHLSAEAKVIYALILSRTQLSASEKYKGKYTDLNHAVFVYYTQKQLMERSGLKRHSVQKALDELTCNHLLIKISQGKGKANRLYILVPDKDFRIEEEKDLFAPGLFDDPEPEDSIYGRTIKVTYDRPVSEIRPG